MKSLLASATYELCKDTTPEDWRRIANETELEFAWIRAFAKGEIKDGGAARLEQLHKALTGKPFPAVA